MTAATHIQLITDKSVDETLHIHATERKGQKDSEKERENIFQPVVETQTKHQMLLVIYDRHTQRIANRWYTLVKLLH